MPPNSKHYTRRFLYVQEGQKIQRRGISLLTVLGSPTIPYNVILSPQTVRNFSIKTFEFASMSMFVTILICHDHEWFERSLVVDT